MTRHPREARGLDIWQGSGGCLDGGLVALLKNRRGSECRRSLGERGRGELHIPFCYL